MDPGPLTLRELCLMDRARQRAGWERTSLLACLLYNANRDPEQTRAASPADFNPYAPRSATAPPAPKARLRDMKGAFVR